MTESSPMSVVPNKEEKNMKQSVLVQQDLEINLKEEMIPVCKFHIDEEERTCTRTCKRRKDENYEIVCLRHFKYQYDPQTGRAVLCGYCKRPYSTRVCEKNHIRCAKCERRWMTILQKIQNL
jgi:hypothetical protein